MANKIGLALGAGGARGISHIGVIRKLHKEGVKISCVSGASMGAIIGSAYALGISMEKVEERVGYVCKKRNWHRFFDVGLKQGALLKGEKIRKYLSDVIGEAEFKDARIPLAISATDLGSGEEVVIQEGKIVDAVMASIAVPGVFPPRETSGSYLVDGGLSNPTPASSLVSMGADKLIAVDFMLKLEKLKREPGLFSILMHSYEIIRAQNSRVKLDAIDKEMIIIKPDIRKAIDSFKFYDIVKFVQAGEKAVEEKMEEIKK